MLHIASKAFTPIVDAPGRAIEAALRIAEPDYERLNKWWRFELQARLLHKIWKARAYERSS